MRSITLLAQNEDLAVMARDLVAGHNAAHRSRACIKPYWPDRRSPTMTTYRVTDRLHEGRVVHVSVEGIVSTVSAWLAELGASSPLVEDLARAVRDADWLAAYAIGEHLSVDVAVAA
jgi:hypothetical protein